MRTFLFAFAAAGLGIPATAAREFEAVDGVRIAPLRIAEVSGNGSIGSWHDYVGSRDLLNDILAFDVAEPDVDGSVSGSVGAPIGFNSCGLGEPEDPAGNRWYFGTTYNNPFAAGDIKVRPGDERLSQNR